MVRRMAPRPIVFALANPTPEIMPDEVREAAPDAMIATGRSDYPNQVNNVLCFPFIFRGALDVGATEINDEMKIACIDGIAALARATTSAEAAAAYQGEQMTFGADYLIPKPFDPRLMGVVACAVAKAACATGVATRPIADFEDYKRKLDGSVFRSALIMRPVFEASATAERKIVFAEGEDERVLRAAMAMIEETNDKPILIGRPEVIEARAERIGLPIRPGRDFDLVNPENDPRYREYWETYHGIMERRGVTPDLAKAIMRTNTTAIAAVMVHRGEADSLICGTFGQYLWHLKYVRQVLARGGLHPVGALSLMILEDGPLFVADTQVHPDPTPEQVAEVAVGAARHARRFGLTPKVALCSHSQFGNLDTASGVKMRGALALLDAREADFVYEGEMHADAALDPELRARIFPGSRMEGAANILIFSNTDAAVGRAQHPQGEGAGAGGRADPDGDGQPGAYRDAVDHGAGAPEHVGHRGDAGRALRLRRAARGGPARRRLLSELVGHAQRQRVRPGAVGLVQPDVVEAVVEPFAACDPVVVDRVGEAQTPDERIVVPVDLGLAPAHNPVEEARPRFHPRGGLHVEDARDVGVRGRAFEVDVGPVVFKLAARDPLPEVPAVAAVDAAKPVVAAFDVGRGICPTPAELGTEVRAAPVVGRGDGCGDDDGRCGLGRGEAARERGRHRGDERCDRSCEDPLEWHERHFNLLNYCTPTARCTCARFHSTVRAGGIDGRQLPRAI